MTKWDEMTSHEQREDNRLNIMAFKFFTFVVLAIFILTIGIVGLNHKQHIEELEAKVEVLEAQVENNYADIEYIEHYFSYDFEADLNNHIASMIRIYDGYLRDDIQYELDYLENKIEDTIASEIYLIRVELENSTVDVEITDELKAEMFEAVYDAIRDDLNETNVSEWVNQILEENGFYEEYNEQVWEYIEQYWEDLLMSIIEEINSQERR